MTGERATSTAPGTAPPQASSPTRYTGANGSPVTGNPSTGHIEADDAAPSEDGYETGTDTSSNTSTSISSSVRDFNFENKRRYHKFKEGRYILPNDDLEQAREDMKHAMVVEICGGALHNAPLENPQKVLDVGTGTGIWAIDSRCYPILSLTDIND